MTIRELLKLIITYKWYLIAFALVCLGIFHKYIFEYYINFITPKEIVIDYKYELSFLFSTGYIDRKHSLLITSFKYASYLAIVLSFLSALSSIGKKNLKEMLYDALATFTRIYSILIIIYLVVLFLVLVIVLLVFSFGFFSQDYTNISFWKNEIESGVLALRLTTLVILFNLYLVLDVAVRVDKWGEKRGITWKSNFSTVGEKILIRLVPDILQLYFYMLVIYILIISTTSNVTGFHVAITSWALFFIIDDWKIITDYKNIKNICIIKSHRIRLTIFNALLLISSSLVAHSIFNSNVTFLFIATLIIFGFSVELMISYLIKNNLTKCHNKDYIFNWMSDLLNILHKFISR